MFNFKKTSKLLIFLVIASGISVSVPYITRSHSFESREENAQDLPFTPVITPNGTTMPWHMDGDVKVFEITVGLCKHEIAPGMVINAWCYNDQTPGPTIEAVEGDRVRMLVTNKLPESTAVHWHGILVPSGMDGVQGLTQKPIQPGETFLYEFTLKQHGTFMYHSHGDEMVQMGLGTMGFFIIHPKEASERIDRDFAIFLNEWFVEPGSSTPNPSIMTDFNIFTFNSRAFPGTDPLVAKTGDHVRIRIGNVGQESHPIHLHGHNFKVVATDGGDVPESAQWPETTVVVFPGQTRDIEFIANAGDWALHCHRRHHPMNAMGHEIPNMIGVKQSDLDSKIQPLLPDYMSMGENGMDEMNYMHMQGPPNTLSMMGGDGPFGPVGMGGMFTILKVRDNIKDYNNPGWYPNPPGTVAESIHKGEEDNGNMKNMNQGMDMGNMQMGDDAQEIDASGASTAPQSIIYTCPMHPEVRQPEPGECPKCGMALKPKKNETDSNQGQDMSDHELHP